MRIPYILFVHDTIFPHVYVQCSENRGGWDAEINVTRNCYTAESIQQRKAWWGNPCRVSSAGCGNSINVLLLVHCRSPSGKVLWIRSPWFGIALIPYHTIHSLQYRHVMPVCLERGSVWLCFTMQAVWPHCDGQIITSYFNSICISYNG